MDYDGMLLVIGRERSLDILDLLAQEGKLNYSEIEAGVETSSEVIDRYLKLQIGYGLIDRDERSSRDVRYSLTGRGEEVLERVAEIERLLKSTD
jgi:DNA-binding HxlR family transcriptional regulator